MLPCAPDALGAAAAGAGAALGAGSCNRCRCCYRSGCCCGCGYCCAVCFFNNDFIYYTVYGYIIFFHDFPPINSNKSAAAVFCIFSLE